MNKKLAQSDEQIAAIEKVLEECRRQDHKWGSHRRHPHGYWYLILLEEVGELAKEILKDSNEHKELEKELIHVAAVALCWLEAYQNSIIE